MESWRLVWRDGFVPVLSTCGLEALRDALRGDDPRLTQGSTTTPPPLMCVQDWPCEAEDALSFCGWQGEELTTVGEVGEFFAKVCFDADQLLGEPAACRWFLNWFDDTPRDEMRRELGLEVDRVLSERDRFMKQTFPTNSVVVRVPRSLFPMPLSAQNEYHQKYPYVGVETYNLVIVPSGILKSRLGATDLLNYGYLWSGKSGRLYEWGDYYSGEFRTKTEVGGEKVFVECVPDKKDHRNPPRAVNVYASTAGVVWLALRAVSEMFSPTPDLGCNAQKLVSLDDAPFSTYFDMLEELGDGTNFESDLRERLSLFFGITEGL